jgi:hypothetical protein
MQGQTLTFTPRLKKYCSAILWSLVRLAFSWRFCNKNAKYVQLFFVYAVTFNMTFKHYVK